jgi:hypothetical protein
VCACVDAVRAIRHHRQSTLALTVGLPLIGDMIGSRIELVPWPGFGHAVCMPQMSADGAEYTVVLKSRSGARVRPGFYIDLADFPDGLGGRVQLRVSTRWDDAGLEHPIPRELWMAVRSELARRLGSHHGCSSRLPGNRPTILLKHDNSMLCAGIGAVSCGTVNTEFTAA